MSRAVKKSSSGTTGGRPRSRNKSGDIQKSSQLQLIQGDIPSAYNVDTIVMMPVNVDRNFIYWEVTTRLLNGNSKALNKGSFKLVVKVYEAMNSKEIYSFEAHERVGKHYMSCAVPVSSVFAEIGILKGRKFACLIRSDIVSLTTVTARAADHEIWMNRTDESCTSEKADRQIDKISRPNPFMRQYVHDSHELSHGLFSSSTHLRKRK